MKKLAKEITRGRRLTRTDDLSIFETADLPELAEGADLIRSSLCHNRVHLCTIINGRSGKCGEDCKFCAQSSSSQTGCETYDMLDEETILRDCKEKEAAGVHSYSIVTAGRSVAGKDLDKLVKIFARLHKECEIHLCSSNGLLSFDAFCRLKDAGVETYHENIETSRRNFPNICSTHTYEDKIEKIRLAKKAGLNVCSGGIIGMGETWEDRIDMALSLSELEIFSIPLNALRPIPGTPLGNLPPLTEDEIVRTVAMFRYINPTAYIRIAAGRAYFEDGGRRLFTSGANATITGNMLTTTGNNIREDMQMFRELGFDIASAG
ncbi:MAG: biotin synthase BioB [Lachnospiraceae bacterium]|nr:biotin synthase BioB [Lachnospiraceae bacterium]